MSIMNCNQYVRWRQSQIFDYWTTLTSQKILLFRRTINETELTLHPEYLHTFLNILKNHNLFYFKQIIEIAVLDRPDRITRFKVNYVLSSLLFNIKLILSTEVPELQPICSAVQFFNSTEWLEREVWDLYGIQFGRNRNLRRIVTDYGFKGHPLRKDFPLTGFLEIYYNDEEKKIIYDRVELAQEFRVFSLTNPWISAVSTTQSTESAIQLLDVV